MLHSLHISSEQEVQHNAAHTHTPACVTGQTQADSHGRCGVCVNAESSITTQWNSEGYKWGRWPYSLCFNSELMDDWKTMCPHKVIANHESRQYLGPARVPSVVKRKSDDCSLPEGQRQQLNELLCSTPGPEWKHHILTIYCIQCWILQDQIIQITSLSEFFAEFTLTSHTLVTKGGESENWVFENRELRAVWLQLVHKNAYPMP